MQDFSKFYNRFTALKNLRASVEESRRNKRGKMFKLLDLNL
jgi:hypothetical protein